MEILQKTKEQKQDESAEKVTSGVRSTMGNPQDQMTPLPED